MYIYIKKAMLQTVRTDVFIALLKDPTNWQQIGDECLDMGEAGSSV